ncbi:MAG: hypothetical protein R6V05_08640 [Candidatus Brocadiia bacterium]
MVIVVLLLSGCYVRRGWPLPGGKGYIVGVHTYGTAGPVQIQQSDLARIPLGPGHEQFIPCAGFPGTLGSSVYDWHRDRYYCWHVTEEGLTTGSGTAQIVSLHGSTGEFEALCQMKYRRLHGVDMDISPDGRYLLLSTEEALYRYDLPDGGLTRLSDPAYCASFGAPCILPDGTVYVPGAFAHNELYALNPETGAIALVCRLEESIVGISPDGRLCATLDGNRTGIVRLPGGEAATELKVEGLNKILRSAWGWPEATLTFVGPRQLAYIREYDWWWTLPVEGIHIYDLKTGKEHLLRRGSWWPMWYMPPARDHTQEE